MKLRADSARRGANLTAFALLIALGVWLAWPGSPTAAQVGDLSVSTAKAPVAPDGMTVGAHPDFVVTFVDRDPAVPGIPILVGGTVSIELPAGFVNLGELPVTGITSIPECGPPGSPFLCSTGVLLQGWPQSLELPFPAVAWDAATNTLTITSTVDWSAIDGPGVKQAHLLLFGFENPAVPGSYPLKVTIQPDPDDETTLTGTGVVEILAATSASLNPMSIINPGPPPPFPNPLYQTIGLGETPLKWGFYLWNADSSAPVGTTLVKMAANHYRLTDGDGKAIGDVWIDAPAGASEMELSAEPAADVPAFVTGIPTALLTAQFTPDPAVLGDYVATWQIYDGDPVALVPGLNEVVYGGPDGPLTARLASIAGEYTVVWRWLNATQEWLFYRPQLAALSTLTELRSGDIYWIGTTSGASLATGSLTQVFLSVEARLSATITAVDDSGVSGSATLSPAGDGTRIEVVAQGLSEGDHANHVHHGSCAEQGAIHVPLTDLSAAAAGDALGETVWAENDLDHFATGHYVAIHELVTFAVIGCGDVN